LSDSGNAQQAKGNGEDVTVDGARMSFFDHLNELASRLKKALLAFIIAFVAVSSVPNPFHPFGGPNSLFGYNFLVITLVRLAESDYAGYKFYASDVITPITVFINVSLVLALVVSLPVIFNEVYGFVAPGLYLREKKAVRKYIAPFALLFSIGAIFGLFIIFPLIMKILLSFYTAFALQNLVELTAFVNLLLLIPVLTGLAFTFPVFLVPLVELKILSAKQLSSARKWVYIIVALGVSIANPDPTDLSSLPIIIPVFILYEITILIAKRVERNRQKAATVTAGTVPG
jgi:sec-independent protein translocase protein TatC